MSRRAWWLAVLGTALVLVLAVWQLEAERATVAERVLETEAGQVTLYRATATPVGPLVLVTHGFAGSRQMMQYISRDLARAGFTVAAFDFFGHGRSDVLLSPDVTRIEGTTRQLIAQTRAVAEAVRTETGVSGPMAMLGHSMATDIIVRAAQEAPDVAAVVAISMYSDAVTESFPERLLILSGEWEGRLRDYGLRVIAQIDPQAGEGETARRGDVLRRSVAVPRTEHVAVLFAPVTMDESRAWLTAALPAVRGADGAALMPRGWHILGALAAIMALSWTAARILPRRVSPPERLPARQFLAALLSPILPAMLAAILINEGLLGMAGFGGLTVFLAVWGLATLAVLWRIGRRPGRPQVAGVLFLLLGAGGFALALDRYGAAFLPVGPRAPLMLLLLAGTAPFALADRMLVAGAAVWQRALARAVPVLALVATMLMAPQSLGLLFTVVPVMVLYFVVYNTMARPVAQRLGPETAACALALVLAWSIAASTPLFALPQG